MIKSQRQNKEAIKKHKKFLKNVLLTIMAKQSSKKDSALEFWGKTITLAFIMSNKYIKQLKNFKYADEQR